MRTVMIKGSASEWAVLSHHGEWYNLRRIDNGTERVVHYSDVEGGFINNVPRVPGGSALHSGIEQYLADAITTARGQAGGLKFDAGKDQWGLLLSGKGMLAAVQGVVRVLMFGAKKYAAHSWREVEDNERRYLDGLMRHYAAIMRDGLQAKDEESGLLHIDHLNCNGLFLGELARVNKG